MHSMCLVVYVMFILFFVAFVMFHLYQLCLVYRFKKEGFTWREAKKLVEEVAGYDLTEWQFSRQLMIFGIIMGLNVVLMILLMVVFKCP